MFLSDGRRQGDHASGRNARPTESGGFAESEPLPGFCDLSRFGMISTPPVAQPMCRADRSPPGSAPRGDPLVALVLRSPTGRRGNRSWDGIRDGAKQGRIEKALRGLGEAG